MTGNKEKIRNGLVWREGNRLKTRNLTAYWLEEIIVEAKFAGTVYIVDGEYVGTETLPFKLKRIMANEEMRSIDGEGDSL